VVLIPLALLVAVAAAADGTWLSVVTPVLIALSAVLNIRAIDSGESVGTDRKPFASCLRGTAAHRWTERRNS
jgi:hypothetical protein